MTGRLKGKRALITQADTFMGPHVADLFRREGALVIENENDLATPEAAARLVEETGHIDILVANFADNAARVGVTETSDEILKRMFTTMMVPLHCVVRAVLPQMINRKAGKVLVMGSATGLRGVENTSAYSAIRGAQLAYVRTVGAEMGPHNVQVNAIAQTYVMNETYFPSTVRNTPIVQQRLSSIPARRMAEPEEAAALAVFLACGESDFFFGQCVPFSGGWIS